MPAESLVPGYKLVDSFGLDSEYVTRDTANPEGSGNAGEVAEEEVEYATLEISGIADVDPNLLTSYRLIGLDTPTPFLQLSSSGNIFKGRHHQLLGTELLFTHSQGDSDPSARHISLLGTTEKRVVFSPVEVRNPPNPSTAGNSAKGKTPGKSDSSSQTLKKGKKKANHGSFGIEEVVGSPSVGVLRPAAPDERGPAAESGPSTRARTAGKKKGNVAQEDDSDGLYAAEGGGDAEGAGTSGTVTTDPAPRRKRKSIRQDPEEGPEFGPRSVQDPVTTTPLLLAAPTMLGTEPDAAQVQDRYVVLPTEIPMAIDPALEAFYAPNEDPAPARASGT